MEIWKAVGGTVTIHVSPGVRARQPQRYRVFMQLDNLELVSPSGVCVRTTLHSSNGDSLRHASGIAVFIRH
jgi:hypothetical protein